MIIYNETLTNCLYEQQKELNNLNLSSGDILVTKKYEPNSYTYYKDIKCNVVNMYAYFQKSIDMKPHDLHVRLSGIFDLSKVKIISVDNNQSNIYQNGQLIAHVNIASLTNQLIGSILWLNSNGEKICADIYDRKGFKSSTQYYKLDGSIGNQIFYDIDGNVVLEIIMNNNQLTYKLINYQGNGYLFENEQSLWSFFKSEFNKNISKN